MIEWEKCTDPKCPERKPHCHAAGEPVQLIDREAPRFGSEARRIHCKQFYERPYWPLSYGHEDGHGGPPITSPDIMFFCVPPDDDEPRVIYSWSLVDCVTEFIDSTAGRGLGTYLDQDQRPTFEAMRDNFLRCAAMMDELLKVTADDSCYEWDELETG